MRPVKFCFALLFFVTCFLRVSSQSLSIGISGGPAWTDLRLENNFTDNLVDPAIGFKAGLNMTWRFSKFLGLRTGLDFDRKAGKSDLLFSDENGTAVIDVTHREMFDFVSLPILLEASFGNKIKGIVQIGQSVGVLVQQTTAFKNLPPMNGEDRFHRTDDFRRFEHAIIAGLGLEANLNEKMAFQFLLRPTYGLTNINDDNFFFQTQELRTFSVAGTIGLQLFLH